MMPELLAPAGSIDALYAAVRSGADAVYMGMDRFNARRNASNFDDAAFCDAVRYCRQRGVAVHLTLNTLISDSEMAEALDCLRVACAAGVDAVIVQDIGLAKLVRKAAPDMPIHASTQMSIHSSAALPMLKEMGFSRVVLSRELSKQEMARITADAKALGIETEVFVHGALCMCLSGQCYMSAVIGQRSGNRGTCAQPCRLAFADGSYPLSLKDMSLLEWVDELAEMGVASFKIEGRMKRPEYVAAAVSAFRSRLDSGEVDSTLKNQLDTVFSRSGHTDGYYTGKLGADMFGRRTETDEAASAQSLSQIHALYRAERQSVAVDARFTLRAGQPSALTLSDGENEAAALGDEPQVAINRPLDSERAEQLCFKLGGTPFAAGKFTADIEEGLTLPASAVNELRRRAVAQLLELRAPKEKAFSAPKLDDISARAGKKPRLFVRFAKAEQIPDDLSGVDRVYLPLGERMPDLPTEVGVELPRAMFGREDKIRERLKGLPEKVKFALCNNLSSLAIANEAGLSAHAGFGINIFNRVAADSVLESATDATLSFELTLSQARAVGVGGIIAYGRLPLMLTRNCPSGTHNCKTCSRELVDRKRAVFPISCHDGFSEIFNSLPLYLDDRLDGFDFIELYFTDEDKARCRQVIDAFRKGERLEGEFTRGLSRRGVF